MIELGQIISGLIQRTAEGKLNWTRSVQANRFIASVDVISVAISKASTTRYRLDIFDESGETVESLGSMDLAPGEDEELERLFVLARRSAHHVDLILEKLAKGLDLR